LDAHVLVEHCSSFALPRLDKFERQSRYWKDVSPEIRQTLRNLKIRRETSRRYGLNDDAFVDLRELVAMLREQLRDQTERYEESLELSRQVSDTNIYQRW